MSIGALKDCINHYSYGEICVGCNACGRLNKETMWQSRYEMYVRDLKEETEKIESESFKSNLQQMNIASDIVWLGEKIKECVQHIDFGGMDYFEIDTSDLQSLLQKE